MLGQYKLSEFSNKLLDRIGEIYYDSMGQPLPADFNTIKQSYVNINNININSYEEKLKSEKGNSGYYDESISEIANGFVKYLGSTNYWEIIRKGEKLYFKKIGGGFDESNILYPPSTFIEKASSLFLPSSRGSSPRGSSPRGTDNSRSATPVSYYSPYITPSSSPRGSSSNSSPFTTPSSSPRGQEVSLDELLSNSNKGGKKRSKRRRSKKKKSRKGKSKRRK